MLEKAAETQGWSLQLPCAAGPVPASAAPTPPEPSGKWQLQMSNT